MLNEPDVALTDYGLTAECALLAYLIQRAGAPGAPLRSRFALFFAAAGLATLAGGTVHGFFPDPASRGARTLWPLTLVAIGLAALAAWAVGARLGWPPAVSRKIELGAATTFVLYAGVVASGLHAFTVAIFYYLPAAAFLLVVFARTYRRTRARPVLTATLGLGATFVAAAVQQARVGLHPAYFNHNAVYHVIQAAALLMLFRGARWLVESRAGG